ncbi:MAG: SIMPL domain-containing protein, partial [Pseudorhizobium sp.]
MHPSLALPSLTNAPAKTLFRLSLGGLLLLTAAVPVSAQDMQPRREPLVRVSGQGETSVAPDTAIVTFAVVRNSQTAEVALGQNSSAMAAVTAALRAEGVEAKDMQTSNFAIYPQYRHSQPKEDGSVEPPQVVGY